METSWDLGDNRGWEEGGTLMVVTILMKATSPKWELSEPIRSGHLTSPKRRNEQEWRRRQKRSCKFLQLSITQRNLIQYSQFHQEMVSVYRPWLVQPLTSQHPDDIDTELCWRPIVCLISLTLHVQYPRCLNRWGFNQGHINTENTHAWLCTYCGIHRNFRRYIWRLFHLWLRLITFGGQSAHLAYLVHKSGRKTLIIIIIIIIIILGNRCEKKLETFSYGKKWKQTALYMWKNTVYGHS